MSDEAGPAGIAVSPSLTPTLIAAEVPPQPELINRRAFFICAVSIGLGVLGAIVAQALALLIGLITNLAFYGRVDTAFVSPAQHQLGVWLLAVPVSGGIIVGLMARFGSSAIRGHGIPEAMEQVLTRESVIPARITLLKPISAAISIGTGGPFGAEGPIIASGGALGSLLGQLLRTTAGERKTLLAAGAAAGMAATFGSPIAAVLLAVELLLFEFRPASFIPVALASTTAAGLRLVWEGQEAVFAIPQLHVAGGLALLIHAAIGVVAGVAAVGVTRAVYAIEDSFERLPVHWMWWPALGAVVVGAVGYFAPRTLGVGYENITDIITQRLTLSAIAVLASLKLISWLFALGSGTSGGTLAPLFTIGGGLGALLGAGAAVLFPASHVDPRMAAIVGMAAIFAGASRAVLTSIIFAFETTREPATVLPLLAGCTAAYLVSSRLMRSTIMTEKIARRGVRVPVDYTVDLLEQQLVSAAASHPVVTLQASRTLGEIRQWMSSDGAESRHQGFPVVDEMGILVGVLTRRDLLDSSASDSASVQSLLNRPPVVVYADCTLREAVNHMLRHDIGRLPVIDRENPHELVGIVTRSDILAAYHVRR